MGNWFTRMCKREQGGIALEAALVMPFFLAFVLAMASIIKLTVTDLALQRALTETTKPIAAYAYPAQLLAVEAKMVYESSSVGSTINELIGRVTSARDKLLQGEQLTERYEAFIPDFMLSLVSWEQQKREQLESNSQEQVDAFVNNQLNPIIRQVFKSLVLQAADTHALSAQRLRVVEVKLPKLDHPGEAFIGITAEYDVRLPIPFYTRIITLRKQCYERLWIGA